LFFSSDNIILPLGGVGAGALVGDVKRGLWGRQASHDGLNEVGDLIWRRCRLRPQCDNPVESFGARVEGDDAVIGFNEAPSHRKTHVAQADKSDLHSDLLALVDLPARAAAKAHDEIVTVLIRE
jgi:hypothetical protein